MKRIIIAGAALLLTCSLQAQEKKNQPKTKKEVIEKEVVEKKSSTKTKKSTDKNITVNVDKDGKEEKTITINVDDNGKKEKTVIVVEDEKVTLNGKPIEDLTDKEMEILVENGVNLGNMGPRLKMDRSLGKLRKLNPRIVEGFNLDMGYNKAVLGVQSKTEDNGAKISQVNKESAAEKAGLKEGDIITKINNKSITKSNSLYKAIGSYKPNDKIDITFLRNGVEQTTSAILDKNDETEERIIEMDKNGFMEMPLEEMWERFPFKEERIVTGFKRPKMGLKIQDVEEGDGVKILNVEENTAAQKAGILVNDVVFKVGDKEVKSVDDFRRQTANTKEGDTILVTVNRNGKQEVLTIKFSKKLKTAEL